MKNPWFVAIVTVLVGVPFVAVILRTQFETSEPRIFWRLNAIPLPFVLSSPTYLRTYRAKLTYDDGSEEEFDQFGILSRIFDSRIDRTVFGHLVRSRTGPDLPGNAFRRAICPFREGEKKVKSFVFTIESPNGGEALQGRFVCD